MRAKYVFLIIALAAASASAARDHDDGGLAAAFALTAGDGRSLALGGAGVALDRLPAMFYNPAALATLERNELATTDASSSSATAGRWSPAPARA
jgi:hypothetical protein